MILFLQAFKHLLNHHILFSADQPTLPDGSASPLAAISLALDDEMQYRCAGYIQAEIERYSDFLADNDGSAGSDDAEKSDKESDNEKEAEGEEGASKKKRNPKKSQDNGE